MKKLLKTVLFFLAGGVNLYAEALFSGNIVSVDPRSGFNAIRNPALMSFSKKDDISLCFNYTYLEDYKAKSDVNIEGNVFDAEINSEESYNCALIFSAVNYMGRHSFGLGVTKGGDGQIRSRRNEFDLRSEELGIRFNEKEDTDILASAVMASYSYRLDRNTAIGVQVEGSASKVDTEKHSRSYITETEALVSDRDVDIKLNRMAAGVALSIFFSDNLYEFGAGVKSGRYGFENQNYGYSDNYNSIRADADISNYYFQDEGAGLIAGFAFKPENNILFAIEGYAVIPYTNEVKSCDDETAYLTEESRDVQTEYIFMVKAGVNWKAGRILAIGAGGSYLKYSSEATYEDNDREQSSEYNIYQLTAGADCKLSSSLNFIAGITYSFTGGEMEEIIPDGSFLVETESRTIDFMGGFTVIY